MRQILIEDYGYSCEKFSAMKDPSAFLTVDAGDCCVDGGIHVAPLVTVQMPHGVKKICDGSEYVRRSGYHWINGPQPRKISIVRRMPTLGIPTLPPGYIYSPGGSTDNYYYYTNQTLQFIYRSGNLPVIIIAPRKW